MSNRKQRLRALKSQIRKAWESWVQTGFALKEIKDDRLYEEEGYERFDAWVSEEVQNRLDVDIQAKQVSRLIAAATLRPKIGDIFGHKSPKNDEAIKPSVALEFARLAPVDESKHGSPRDVDSLKKSDVQRVAKNAAKIAEKRGKKVTAAIVREAVDEDLGISKKKPKPRSNEPQIDLDRFIRHVAETNEVGLEKLDGLSVEMWEALEEDHPGLTIRAALACEGLAEFLRSN